MVGSARRGRITAGLRQPTPDIGWSKEHIAELFGAEGRYEEAVGILERVLSVIDRSELRRSASFTISRSNSGPRSTGNSAPFLRICNLCNGARSIIITTSLITIRTWQKTVAKLLNGHIKTCN